MPTARTRPSTIQSCFDLGLLRPDQTPVEAVGRLLEMCERHDLELSPAAKEAYLIRSAAVPQPRDLSDYTYEIYVTTTAFLRVCRSTGIWMPGTISFLGSGDERTAYATCHVRASQSDPTWLTVGAHATWFLYFERGPDGQSPTDRWAYTGDIALAAVAEVLAARKALGEGVRELQTEAGTLEMAQDARVIQRLRSRAPKPER